MGSQPKLSEYRATPCCLEHHVLLRSSPQGTLKKVFEIKTGPAHNRSLQYKFEVLAMLLFGLGLPGKGGDNHVIIVL